MTRAELIAVLVLRLHLVQHLLLFLLLLVERADALMDIRENLLLMLLQLLQKALQARVEGEALLLLVKGLTEGGSLVLYHLLQLCSALLVLLLLQLLLRRLRSKQLTPTLLRRLQLTRNSLHRISGSFR